MNDAIQFQTDRMIPFWYLVNSGALAASTSGITTLTLQADSSFELHWIQASSDQDAATDVMPNNFSVQISDQSTGRLLSNARIPQRIFCGPANGGFVRQMRPITFPPQANLQFDFLNLVTDDTTNVTLVLGGYKIFLGA